MAHGYQTTKAYRALNSRQRLFVNYVAQGLDDSKAYQKAGYKSKQPWRDAWELRRNPKVRDLLETACDQAGLTGDLLVAYLAQLLQGADLADFTPWLTQENNPKTQKPWTLADLRANGIPTHVLTKAHIYVGGDGRSVQIVSPIDIIREISRLLGLVTEKREVKLSGSADLGGMTDAALRQRAHAVEPDFDFVADEDKPGEEAAGGE